MRKSSRDSLPSHDKRARRQQMLGACQRFISRNSVGSFYFPGGCWRHFYIAPISFARGLLCLGSLCCRGRKQNWRLSWTIKSLKLIEDFRKLISQTLYISLVRARKAQNSAWWKFHSNLIDSDTRESNLIFWLINLSPIPSDDSTHRRPEKFHIPVGKLFNYPPWHPSDLHQNSIKVEFAS